MILRVFLIAISTVFVISCVGSRVDPAVVERIKPGMGRREVIKIVGHQPTTSSVVCDPRGCREILVWAYGDFLGRGQAISVSIPKKREL